MNYNNANNFADSNLLNQKNNNIRDAFVKKLAEEETEEFIVNDEDEMIFDKGNDIDVQMFQY